MPRREKDRKLARRRKREKEKRKLRAKGLLPPSPGAVKTEALKEVGKKKPEKEAPKEVPPAESKQASEPSTPEGQS
jgi:hypothetical protein